MAVTSKTYFLYRHIRNDKNHPFYIGIGTINVNNNYKRAKEKFGRNNLWKKIVSKSDYEIDIIFESDDYEFIKQKEIEFISLYGRKINGTGTLANITIGGEGVRGLKHTEKTKEKISLSLKGKIPSYKFPKGNIPFNKGVSMPDETKIKISNAKKGCVSPNNKSIINKITGEKYSSIMEASKILKINYSGLRAQINGQNKNKSNLIYNNNECS